MPQRSLSPIIACFAVVIALISLNAAAGSRSGLSRPASVVALVNLDTVLSSLEDFKDNRARIDELSKTAQKGLDEVRGLLDKNKFDLEAMMDKSSQEYRQLLAKRVELVATGKGREAGMQQVIDEQGGTMLRTLYVKMVDAVTRYSATEGIDVVLRDDRDILPPEQVRESSGETRPVTSREVRARVDQRSILAASKQVDITTGIITMMNNEYLATKK